MSPLRFPYLIYLQRLILPAVFAFILAPSGLLHPQMVEAKPHFSIPGLHALQKKFSKKRRRRRNSHRKKQLKNAAPVAAPLLLDDKNNEAAPPLPVRNPRHVKRQKAANKLQDRMVKWQHPNVRTVRSIAKRPKPNQPTTKALMPAPGASSPELPVMALALPPLPIRKPRRHPSQVVEADWTPALVSDAVEQCAALGIEIKPLPPVKKGLCGNPAPILLAQVDIATVRPAATLSCPMAANLQRWFEQSVQPLAQKHFGKKVKQIRNISSYVCRNRYGDTKTRISEHAYANALDISWFELQGGEKISVKDDWKNPEGTKSAFLHELHSSACKLFGTVLGPDANDAHHDHFHLDKAPRKRSNYCR